jgi:hypothetical protein
MTLLTDPPKNPKLKKNIHHVDFQLEYIVILLAH